MKGSVRVINLVAIFLLMSFEVSNAVYHYSLSYSYFDEIAQAYCASRSPGWVFAIRRNCERAKTCKDMCAAASAHILKYISYQRKSVACYDAFQIKKHHAFLRANPGHFQPDSGVVNMGTYGYGAGGCTWRENHCGPNYCCCKAF